MTPSKKNQKALEDLLKRMGVDNEGPNGHTNGRTSHRSDQEVIELCRKAKNANKFANLFDDGDLSAYEDDDSRADQALVSIIAFYTQDPDQIDSIFRHSALYRQKWERPDYRQRTIDFALSNLAETYQGHDGARMKVTRDTNFDSSKHKEGSLDESKLKPLPFKTGSEIATSVPEETEWVAYPWFAKNTITEVSGPIKRAGKTTFLAHAVAKILDGEPFLGGKTQKTKVLYLTEQSPNSFRRVIRDAKLDRDDIKVLYWHEVRGIEWEDLIRAVCDEAGSFGAEFVVIDVISRWASFPGVDESTPAYADRAMPVLKEANARGLTVAYARHDRKGGGEVGESGRGTSQVGGDVDQMLQLTHPGGNARETVRVLEAVGRFMDDTPAKLNIELIAGEYHSLGDSRDFAYQQAANIICEVLPTTIEAAITADEGFDRASKHGVKRSTFNAALKNLSESGEIKRVGQGKKGDPHRYYRPTAAKFVSSKDPSYRLDETKYETQSTSRDDEVPVSFDLPSGETSTVAELREQRQQRQEGGSPEEPPKHREEF